MSWHPGATKKWWKGTEKSKSSKKVGVVIPAYGTLAVGGPLGDRERLAHLGLCEAEREAPQFERLRELLDVVQVDAVHDVAGGLVDGGRICGERKIIH